MSHAAVEGALGGLAQAHFGLSASAAIASGTIYNDRLKIREVVDETEADLPVTTSRQARKENLGAHLIAATG
jgi:hypothetical protein